MPYGSKEKGGLGTTSTETFIRVLLNLQYTSHIEKWDSLATVLRDNPDFFPFLFDLQTLANLHGLKLDVSTYTVILEASMTRRSYYLTKVMGKCTVFLSIGRSKTISFLL